MQLCVPRVPRTIVAALLVWLIGPASARAQGTARSLDFDTSIRAAGMGGAGAGVGWGEASLWGNPAALALRRGMHWEHTRTQLVPGLAEDVFLESDQLAVGYFGLAVASMGDPVGGLRLSYGFSDATDGSGAPIGSFESYEEVEGSGAACSLIGLLDAVRRLTGADSQLASFGDVSLGFQRRRARVSLFGDEGSRAEPDVRDWGALVRVSPIHRGVPGHNHHVSVDLGFGTAVLGANDARIELLPSLEYPVSRIRRTGGAIRVAYHGEPFLPGRNRVMRLVSEGALPVVSLSLAADEERISAGDLDANRYTVRRHGLELGIANMAFVRIGHVEDLTGNIVDGTYGWGLQLPLADVAGVRFDHASVPQSSGLEDVKRNGWSMWFDPIALAHQLRRHTSSITS